MRNALGAVPEACVRFGCLRPPGRLHFVMIHRVVAAAFLLGASAAAFADGPEAPVAAPKCRAVDAADPSKVLAEAEDKLTTRCERLLEAKVRAGACTDVANKGKRLELVTQFDHMVGKTRMKDGKITVVCPR